MKEFDNIKFENGSPETGIFRYVDVLLTAVNLPPQGSGFTPKENYERTELYKKLVLFKDKDKVKLEDADFKTVMGAYDLLSFEGRNDEAADMYAYFMKIR